MTVIESIFQAGALWEFPNPLKCKIFPQISLFKGNDEEVNFHDYASLFPLFLNSGNSGPSGEREEVAFRTLGYQPWKSLQFTS